MGDCVVERQGSKHALVIICVAKQMHGLNNLLRRVWLSTAYAVQLGCWHWRPVVPKLWTKSQETQKSNKIVTFSLSYMWCGKMPQSSKHDAGPRFVKEQMHMVNRLLILQE